MPVKTIDFETISIIMEKIKKKREGGPVKEVPGKHIFEKLIEKKKIERAGSRKHV